MKEEEVVEEDMLENINTKNLIVNYNFIVVSTPFPLWMTLQSYVNEYSMSGSLDKDFLGD